jgi:hypothetical protein
MAQTPTDTIQCLPPSRSPDAKRTPVTVLQFLVGALVTIGGTLFATFALNGYARTLGFIHLEIGLLALAGGFVAMNRVLWSRP